MRVIYLCRLSRHGGASLPLNVERMLKCNISVWKIENSLFLYISLKQSHIWGENPQIFAWSHLARVFNSIKWYFLGEKTNLWLKPFGRGFQLHSIGVAGILSGYRGRDCFVGVSRRLSGYLGGLVYPWLQKAVSTADGRIGTSYWEDFSFS